MSPSRAGWVGGLLAVLACAPATQDAPGPRDGEYPAPFGVVTGVHGLSDGRVMVVDGRRRAVLLVDWDAPAPAAVGARGDGPDHYLGPMRLFSIRGDTVLLEDPELGRLLPLTPSGAAGAPELDRSAYPALWQDGMGLRGADSLGSAWLAGPFVDERPEGPMPKDSTPVLRVHRRTARVDTVTMVRLPALTLEPAGGGMGPRVLFQPWQVLDEWAVAPDGRVAVARGEPYRLEWIAPNGDRVAGPVVSYEPVRVTAADREGSRGGGRVWPEVKPAFGYRGALETGAVLVDPMGRAWVHRLTGAGQEARYDVFDSRGVLLGQVSLAADLVVKGFGSGWVFTVRASPDGNQYLGRVPFTEPK